jgi:nucleoside-diphosphate-sugar epimerase
MIFFNGATGGMGRYLGDALKATNQPHQILKARLEDSKTLVDELNLGKYPPQTTVTLIQMAAMVSVPECEINPEKAIRTNVESTLVTMEEFIKWAHLKSLQPRIFYVSTGHIYAPKKHNIKINESNPTAPKSVYAKTKLAAENGLLKIKSQSQDLQVIIGRVFGLIAVNQPLHYVLPGLIRRVKDKNLGEIPGLGYFRDYLDARDVCRNISLLTKLEWKGVENVVPPIINICSGHPVSIRNMLECIIEVAGEDKTKLDSLITEAPGRPTDIRWIVGDPTRLESLTGQAAQTISLKQTIIDQFK